MVLRDTRNQTLGLSWCAGLRFLNIPEYTAVAKWNLEAGSHSVRGVLNSAPPNLHTAARWAKEKNLLYSGP